MTARPQGRRPDPARRAHVVSLLEPVVAAAGFDVEDVELRTVGRRLLVRVLVDGEQGITLDDIAQVAQAVSEALDADTDGPLGDEPYTLEVSSPGVDRPLTLPRHWRRNLGRLVAVTLTDHSQVTGRVVAVSDVDVELETDTKGRKARRTVALADVARAVVEVEFSRPSPEPGADQAATDELDATDEIDGTDDTDDTDDADGVDDLEGED